jgi:DNA-binding NarL/FixJ family response regulator
MTVRNCCPGCRQTIAATASWCVPCEKRMPSALRDAERAAHAALQAARQKAVDWLKAHPHATSRELQVIALAAQGLANCDIAERQHMSVDQVKDALRQVSHRWGCSGRAHVVATAFRLGYLHVETGSGR